MKTNISKSAEVLKVSDHGIVFGWAIVCTEKGEPYFDKQADHIPEDSMFAAAADFMEHSRSAKVMHAGEVQGEMLFAFPLTEETKKAFNLACDKTGLMIGMKPNADMLAKFKSGELKAFSIGGERGVDEEVA